MDRAVVEQLSKAGIDAVLSKHFPTIPIQVDDQRRVVPLSEEVPVKDGEAFALVRLKNIRELFTGTAQPPDFSSSPPPAYQPAFILIEVTALEHFRVTGKAERDMEFHRMYAHLRRRPDGEYPNPLFSYLRAAARLYMSIRDLSQAEFEGIVGRLSRSAKHFSMGETSRNYINTLDRTFPA